MNSAISAMWTGLARRRNRGRIAERLYFDLVERARQARFYAQWGVPDTVDGRFDMIALHASLSFRSLSGRGREGRRLAQALWDRLIADMDHNLREMGVGDLGVGKRIKSMAKALLGRLRAYDAALSPTADESALGDALVRNLWRGRDPGPEARAEMVRYVLAEVARLEADPRLTNPDGGTLQ